MNWEYELKTFKDILIRVRAKGYEDGRLSAKQDYAKMRGIARCHKATLEEQEKHGFDLWGWCECHRPIIGRWAGMANFCPWCGKVIEWEDKEE